jgi:hypothetical protein
MNFLGIFNFRAAWLPWVLLGFSLLLEHKIEADVIGIVARTLSCVGSFRPSSPF